MGLTIFHKKTFPDSSHDWLNCGKYPRMSSGILSVPYNIVMDMNSVMNEFEWGKHPRILSVPHNIVMDMNNVLNEFECGKYPKIPSGILSIPYNNVMDMNNVMTGFHIRILFKKKSSTCR